MKPEDPNLDTWIEPELEARLVAQMLGESSEFEQAELERLIKEKPEMAILQRRLDAVHGLVSEATTQGPDDDEWKLSCDRREQLLATMRDSAPRATIETAVTLKSKSKRLIWFLRTASAAAILMLCAVLSTLFIRSTHPHDLAVRSPAPMTHEKTNSLGIGMDVEPEVVDFEGFANYSEPQAASAGKATPKSLAFTLKGKVGADSNNSAEADFDNKAERYNWDFQTLDNLDGYAAAVGVDISSSSTYSVTQTDLSTATPEDMERQAALESVKLAEVNPSTGIVNHINIPGLEHTKDLVGREELGLDPPAVLDSIELAAAPKRLEALAQTKTRAGFIRRIDESWGLPIPTHEDDPFVDSGIALASPSGDDLFGNNAISDSKVPSSQRLTEETGAAGSEALNTPQEIKVEAKFVEVQQENVEGFGFGRVAGGGSTSQQQGQQQTSQWFEEQASASETSLYFSPKRDQPEALANNEIELKLAQQSEQKAPEQDSSHLFDAFSGGTPSGITRQKEQAPKSDSEPPSQLGAAFTSVDSLEDYVDFSMIDSDSGEQDLSRRLRRSNAAGEELSDGLNREPQTATNDDLLAVVPSAPKVRFGKKKAAKKDNSMDKLRKLAEHAETVDDLQTQKRVLAELEQQAIAKDSLTRLHSFYTSLDSKSADTEAERLIVEQSTRVEALIRNREKTEDHYGVRSLASMESAPDLTEEEEAELQLKALAIDRLKQKTEAQKALVKKLKRARDEHQLAREKQAALSEKHTRESPFSTFSLHVSDVAFKLAKAALLDRNTSPDPSKVRVEEFVNAFDYGDPAPTQSDKIASRTEQAAHPFQQQRNLLRVSMRTAATGRSSGQPLRLTLLLDTSGSMERQDRQDAVRRAMEVLTSQLAPNDSVTLIGFARQPRLISDRLTGEALQSLPDLVQHTPAEGGTNLEEALLLATEAALRQYEAAGQNRVVLITDGAANLGDAEPENLKNLVIALRQQGVAFDACGVGAEGLNDAVLEALTRQGDGRYYFLDKPEDADAGFAKQLAGALRPAARNVKVQVRFNPHRVGHYRLMGFEKHRLKKEDFRNDKVDAAEMAAAEAGVALYAIEPLADGHGEIGEIFVRFQDTNTGQMVERNWTIPYHPQPPALQDATPALQLASAATFLAEKLRNSPVGQTVRLEELTPILTNVRRCYEANTRVQDLIAMIEKARSL